jgi:phenylacetate-CoA ligase
MRRMAKITGRSDDMLIIRGVNVFPSQIEELILRTAGLAPHYQLEVTREGPLDALTVKVECDGDALSSEDRMRVTHALVQQMKSYIGITAAVLIIDSGQIERSAGKARRVIDLRKR